MHSIGPQSEGLSLPEEGAVCVCVSVCARACAHVRAWLSLECTDTKHQEKTLFYIVLCKFLA